MARRKTEIFSMSFLDCITCAFGSVVIEDHSTYGSFINDERVVGRTALTVGDRLRLGSPGVTLELIQLVQDDGAPQD